MSAGDYEYRVVDRSFLAPILRKLIWEPALEHVPRSVSANDLSLLGAGFALASLAVLGSFPSGLGLPLAAIFILLAVNLDYLDGMQARRLGTSGPLGEYVDHWLDSLAAASLLWGLAIVCDAGPIVTLALLVLGLVAYTAAFWIHYQRGRLELDAFGSLEAAFIQAGIYLIVARVGREWFEAPRLGPFSAFDLILAYTLVSYARLVAASLSRKAGGSFGLWLPALQIVVAGGWALMAGVSSTIGLLVVIASGVIVNGELIEARTAQRRASLFDPILTVGLVLAFGLLALPRMFHELLGIGLLFVLGLRALFAFRGVLRRRVGDLTERELLRRLV